MTCIKKKKRIYKENEYLVATHSIRIRTQRDYEKHHINKHPTKIQMPKSKQNSHPNNTRLSHLHTHTHIHTHINIIDTHNITRTKQILIWWHGNQLLFLDMPLTYNQHNSLSFYYNITVTQSLFQERNHPFWVSATAEQTPPAVSTTSFWIGCHCSPHQSFLFNYWLRLQGGFYLLYSLLDLLIFYEQYCYFFFVCIGL